MTNSQFAMYAWIKLHTDKNSASLTTPPLLSQVQKEKRIFDRRHQRGHISPDRMMTPTALTPLSEAITECTVTAPQWEKKKISRGGQASLSAFLSAAHPARPPALCRPIPKERRRQNFCCIFIAFPCSTYNSLEKLILFSQEPDDTSPTWSGYPRHCAFGVNS